MMTKLLLSAYTSGVPSPRRIAQRCEEDVAFGSLPANQTPDLRTISDFRKRHLPCTGHRLLKLAGGGKWGAA